MNRKQTLNWIKVKQFNRMVQRANDVFEGKYYLTALEIFTKWHYNRDLTN
jgi:hypothetical protein